MSESADTLPPRPNLEWYRKAAKKKLKAMRSESASATLALAQLAVAREHGFASWRALVAAVNAKSIELAADFSKAFNDAAKAILRRDFDAVGEIIEREPGVLDFNGPHPNWGGKPQLLHVAIEAGDDAIARLLLDSGADPSGNNESYDGWSPLMLAVHWKRDAIRTLLMDRGGSIGLIEALMLGDDKRVKTLVDGDALTRPVPNKATPLHFATTARSAKLLIDRGISLDAKDKYGRTALDAVARAGKPAAAKVLRDKGAIASAETFARLGDLPRLKQAIGSTPPTQLLKPAIEAGQVKIARSLLSGGADVNQPDQNGATPLHHAAWLGSLSLARLLVKAGANVFAEDDRYNATPAGWAQHAAQNFSRIACIAVAGYLKRQEERRKTPPLPEHRQSHKIAKWKPIMDAAYEGRAKEIEKLIKAGADPNIVSTTPSQYRPLHRAIEAKKTQPRGTPHEAAVKALLAGGADPHLRGGWDRLTALQLAAVDSPRFVPMLVELFKPLDFFHACVLLDKPRVTSLLKKDAKAAITRDANGWSPLHYVAASKMYETSTSTAKVQLSIAQRLIDAGADVNATYIFPSQGDWPISVLYMACGKHNNPAMTELLMQAGAEPYDNESVYHASDEGHDECLAVIEKLADKKKLAAECTRCLRTQLHWGRSRGTPWLLAHGADPNVPYPNSGKTALQAAALHGLNDKLIKLLLHHGGDPHLKNAEGKSAIDIALEAKKNRVAKLLQA